MNPKLLAAFDKHSVATYDKQQFLEKLVSDLDWDFDTSNGILSFGNEYQWQAQILGTQSTESDTWLWAWANEASSIPGNLLGAANSLKKLGEDSNLSELVKSQLPTSEYDGHFWSILATGLCKADAYFCGPYDSGAIFLLIKDTAYPKDSKSPLARCSFHFPQAISKYSISNHKRAFVGYTKHLGLTVREHNNQLLIQDDSGAELKAEFDSHARLASLTGELTEASKANKDATAAENIRPDKSRGKSSAATQVNQQNESVGFFEGWARNCRIYYKKATIVWAIVGIVIGLIAWIFTSGQTAGIIGVISFLLLWFWGFIETDR